MKDITLANVMTTIQKSFDYTHPALASHGEQVAYIYLCMLQQKGTYSDEELFEFLSIAFLHDIGAYKTENVDLVSMFDIENFYRHSVYGYLYLKHFSSLKNKAKFVLYHHIDYKYRDRIRCLYVDEVLFLHLADRVAIMVSEGRDLKELYEVSGDAFSREDIDLFMLSNKRFYIEKSIKDGSFKEKIYSHLAKKIMSREEVAQLVSVLAYSIDFRSSDTVTHTISVCEISKYLASRIGMDEEDIRLLEFSSLVHDIGKLYIPESILEKPDRLTDEEMKSMREHALYTKSILNELGYERIAEIATNHHEKLDGSGYPNGLKGEEINIYSRILAVSDIFSALVGIRAYKGAMEKQKVVEILKQMADTNKLDSHLVNIAIDEYDIIMEKISKDASEMFTIYNNMDFEFKELLDEFEKKSAVGILGS